MRRGSQPGQRRGGRQKGVPNKVAAARRERIQSEADPISLLAKVAAGKQIEAATEPGSTSRKEVYPTVEQWLHAANILARKLVPDAKDESIRVEIPQVESAQDLVAAFSTIVRAVTRGELTPLQGVRIAGLLEHKRQALETLELECRVFELERLTAIATPDVVSWDVTTDFVWFGVFGMAGRALNRRLDRLTARRGNENAAKADERLAGPVPTNEA